MLENKAKKHVSGDRKPRIALGLQDEEADFEPAKQMMSNKDFAELINRPVKKWPGLPIVQGLEKPIAPGLEKPIAPGLQVMDDDAIMEELEALMDEEECEHLITIDGRYVQELEQEVHFGRDVHYVCKLENENQELKDELAFLRGILAQMSQRY